MIDPEILLRVRAHLKIAHHVPGRIRLRFAPSILAAVPEIATAKGSDLLDGLRGVENVRVNAAASSLVVTYNPESLPPNWWERLIEGSPAEAEAVVLRLRQPNA
jgi:hypothetical protein